MPKVFESLVFIRHFLPTFKYFKHLRSIQPWKIQFLIQNFDIFIIDWLFIRILIAFKHLVNFFLSCLKLAIRHIIFLLNIDIEILRIFCLLVILDRIIWNKHLIIEVDIKSFAYQIVGLVSRDERRKKYLSINRCYWYWIVENQCVVFLLDLFYIITRDLQLSIAEKYVRRVESRVEK